VSPQNLRPNLINLKPDIHLMTRKQLLLWAVLFWTAFAFFGYGAYYYWTNGYPWYASLSSFGLAAAVVYCYYRYGVRNFLTQHSKDDRKA